MFVLIPDSPTRLQNGRQRIFINQLIRLRGTEVGKEQRLSKGIALARVSNPYHVKVIYSKHRFCSLYFFSVKQY